jgi:hypothetical protein
MPIYSKSTLPHLEKRLQELEEELELACPSLVAEIRLVKIHIAACKATADTTFAEDQTPWAAIYRCLDLYGDYALTKKQIIDAIIEGGYRAAKPKAMNGLLNDSMNIQLRNKRLSYKGEAVGRTKAGIAFKPKIMAS